MRELELWSISRLQPEFNSQTRNFSRENKKTLKKRGLSVVWTILLISCLVGLFSLFSLNASAQSEFRVEGAGVEASPVEYNGACPGIIKFSAKIQANGKGRVKYTWLRNDGAIAPVEYVDFSEAGVKYVSTTWTLGDASVLPRYNGWQQIKILSPNEYFSNKAEFKLTCSQSETNKPDLIIEWAKLKTGEVCRAYNPVFGNYRLTQSLLKGGN